MKLTLIGIAPRPAFKKILLAHGFELNLLKKLGSFADADMVAYAVKNARELKDFSKLRDRFPKSWLAVVIDKKLLDDSVFYDALLACREKNAVWFTQDWEPLFWLSLQQMLEHDKLVADRETIHASENLIRQFERDINLAENIQRSLLPKVSPIIPGISIAAKYIPAPGMGGDYYDIFEFGDKKRFGVLLADSKSHGMAAALLSVLLKLRLEEMKDRFPESNSFVEYLNREIQAMHAKELSSLSLLYGIFDRASLTFRYTTAGPLRPILWRAGSPVPVAAATNPPLGGMDTFAFREHTLTLQPGDLLILHTDGLDAPLSSNSFEKLVNVLGSKDLSPDPLEVQNEVMAIIDRYVESHKLKDDLTLLHFAIDERALYLAQST